MPNLPSIKVRSRSPLLITSPVFNRLRSSSNDRQLVFVNKNNLKNNLNNPGVNKNTTVNNGSLKVQDHKPSNISKSTQWFSKQQYNLNRRNGKSNSSTDIRTSVDNFNLNNYSEQVLNNNKENAKTLNNKINLIGYNKKTNNTKFEDVGNSPSILKKKNNYSPVVSQSPNLSLLNKYDLKVNDRINNKNNVNSKTTNNPETINKMSILNGTSLTFTDKVDDLEKYTSIDNSNSTNVKRKVLFQTQVRVHRFESDGASRLSSPENDFNQINGISSNTYSSTKNGFLNLLTNKKKNNTIKDNVKNNWPTSTTITFKDENKLIKPTSLNSGDSTTSLKFKNSNTIKRNANHNNNHDNNNNQYKNAHHISKLKTSSNFEDNYNRFSLPSINFSTEKTSLYIEDDFDDVNHLTKSIESYLNQDFVKIENDEVDFLRRNKKAQNNKSNETIKVTSSRELIQNSGKFQSKNDEDDDVFSVSDSVVSSLSANSIRLPQKNNDHSVIYNTSDATLLISRSYINYNDINPNVEDMKNGNLELSNCFFLNRDNKIDPNNNHSNVKSSLTTPKLVSVTANSTMQKTTMITSSIPLGNLHENNTIQNKTSARSPIVNNNLEIIYNSPDSCDLMNFDKNQSLNLNNSQFTPKSNRNTLGNEFKIINNDKIDLGFTYKIETDLLTGINKLVITIKLGIILRPHEILVKANKNGNKIRIVTNNDCKPLPHDFNEQLCLPYFINPYQMIAKVDISGNLLVEAPIVHLP